MTSVAYYFKRGVFACRSGDFYVFLDLSTENYLCIPRYEFDAATTSITIGSPVPGSPASAIPLPDNISALLENLADTGVLTTDPELACDHDPLSTCPAFVFEIHAFEHKRRFPRSLLAAPTFLAASNRTHVRLRHTSLGNTVRWIAERKRRVNARGHLSPLCRVQRLVADFMTLRPTFPRPYLCLFDSLALVDFLLLHNISTDWVFGVRAEPFAAHCWVVYNGLLVNDTPDRVAPYTPLMLV